MLLGYARVSKSDGSQSLDAQIDALVEFGVDRENIYTDMISGLKESRPGLDACIKALRAGDRIVIVKLDRLGRDLRHCLNLIESFNSKQIALTVLTGQGVVLNGEGAAARFAMNLMLAASEYERALNSERTKSSLAAARARGRVGGRPYTMTTSKLRLAMASMGKPETNVGQLCREIGMTRQSLYRYVSPTGDLRPDGQKLMASMQK